MRNLSNRPNLSNLPGKSLLVAVTAAAVAAAGAVAALSVWVPGHLGPAVSLLPGYRPAVSIPASRSTPPGSPPKPVPPGKLLSSLSSSPRLEAVRTSYASGHYDQAATAARQMIQAVAKEEQASLPHRWEAARARHLLAFATARQKDMTGARAQFALLRTEAAALPGGGKPESALPGSGPAPTLTEEAAYQHAVCTSALGDRAGAEREYVAFMMAYPESALVQAAIKRVARLHGGDIPPAAEAAWKQAMQTAQVREKERQRDASVCGPECLSELLRRGGKRDKVATVAALATAAKTTERGVSLEALAAVAKARGWQNARGVALTPKGLLKQKLPLIALVSAGPQGHFVLVDRATEETVTVWDPDAEGVGKSASHTYPTAEWQKRWQGGIALVLK